MSSRPYPSRANKDHLFRTDHLESDLRGRSVRSGTITMIGQALKFLIGFGSTMLLARLLTPGDFGLVAKIFLVVGLAEVMKDLGLSMAAIQRAELTHRLASNLFWINVGVSLALGSIVALGAPAIAGIYDDPRVVPVMTAFSAMFVLGGLAAQHQALLQRQMRFAALTAIEIIARVAGLAAAILLAWDGAAYWALVANLLVYAAVFAFLIWPTTRWLPGWPSGLADVADMIRFGVNLSAVNLLNHIGRHFDRAIIGIYVGDTATGFYEKASQLLQQPVHQVNTPVTSVAIPMLSRLQSQHYRFRAAYLRTVSLVMTLTAPLVVFLFVWADAVVLLIFGDQWQETADLFRILAIAGLTRPLANTTGWLFITTGRTAEMLRWRMMTMWITPAMGALGLYLDGVTGVAIAMAVVAIILTVPTICYAQRGTGIGTWAVVAASTLPVMSAAIAGAVLWPIADAIHVLIALPLMFVGYFAVACLLSRSLEPVLEIWELKNTVLKRAT